MASNNNNMDPGMVMMRDFVSLIFSEFKDFSSDILEELKDGTKNTAKLDKILTLFSEFLKDSKLLAATDKELLKALGDLKKDIMALQKVNVTTTLTAIRGFINQNLIQSVKGGGIFDVNSDNQRMKAALKYLDAFEKRLAAATKSINTIDTAGSKLAQSLGKLANQLGKGGKGGPAGGLGGSAAWIFSKNNSIGSIVKGIAGGFSTLIGFLSGGGFFKKLTGAIFDALFEANLVKNGLKDTLRLLFLLAGSWVKRFFTNLLSRFMPRATAEKWGGVAGGATFLGLSSAPWLLKSGLLKGGPKGVLNGLGGIGSSLFRTPKIQTMTSSKAFQTLEHGDTYKDAVTGEFKKIVRVNGFVTEKVVAGSQTARGAAKLAKFTKGGLGPLGIALSAAAEVPALFQAKKEGRFGAQLAESTGGVGGAIAGGAAGAMFGPVGIAIGAMLGDFIGRSLGKGFGKYMAPIGQNLKAFFGEILKIGKALAPAATLIGKVFTALFHLFIIDPLKVLGVVLKPIGSLLGLLVKGITSVATAIAKWLSPAFETLGRWIENLNRAIDSFMGDHPIIAKALGLEPKENNNGGGDYSSKNPGDTNTSGYGRSIFKGKTFDGRAITSQYGEVSDVHGTGHKGVDLAYKKGEKVGAKIGGKVLYTGYDKDGYGNFAVVEDAKGYKHYYGHMASMGVKAGDTLKAGSTIGIAGSTGHSTGVHLHYEVRKPGQKNYLGRANGYDIDPLAYVEKYREEEKKITTTSQLTKIKEQESKKEQKSKKEQEQKKSAFNEQLEEYKRTQKAKEATKVKPEKVASAGTDSAAKSLTGNDQWATNTIRQGLVAMGMYNGNC